jgi:hypothetical protein
MVSPMRKKRAWPPQDRDADGETVAAFEATVAVVKETVVRSGEVLVSAKEDLSDHQRWLKAQTAAVQADRERHDRWLVRQRERQEALERREQRRARRRSARQAAIKSVVDAISGAVHAVRSAVWSVVAKILAFFSAIFGAVASGANWIWASIRDVVLRVVGAARSGVLFVGGTAGNLGRSVARLAGLAGGGVRSAGRTAGNLAGSSTRLVGSGFSRAGSKLHEVAPSAANFLSIAFGGISARARGAGRIVGGWLAAGFAWLKAMIATVTGTAGEALAPASRAIVARAHAATPALWERFGAAGAAGRRYLEQGTRRLQGVLPAAKASPAEDENAVSLPQRGWGFDLSQMLIIAGTLLLVCGGLMLGGGLMLRAKTPGQPVMEAATASDPIAWLFEHTDFPIDERTVFDYAVTPEGLRIKGFAIGGVNMSDGPISALSAVVKPDLHDETLTLNVIVGSPDAAGVQASEAAAAGTIADVIPPQAPFKLVFLFPGTEGGSGMMPEDVVKQSGGILLKVRYEIGGRQKSFIQYLPPVLLEEQLAELKVEAKGS